MKCLIIYPFFNIYVRYLNAIYTVSVALECRNERYFLMNSFAGVYMWLQRYPQWWTELFELLLQHEVVVSV